MSKFEDSITPIKGTVEDVDWTDDVRTRDYYPNRFEYFYKDILCGLLSGVAPKDEDKQIMRAIHLTEKALDSVDERDSTQG